MYYLEQLLTNPNIFAIPLGINNTKGLLKIIKFPEP